MVPSVVFDTTWQVVEGALTRTRVFLLSGKRYLATRVKPAEREELWHAIAVRAAEDAFKAAQEKGITSHSFHIISTMHLKNGGKEEMLEVLVDIHSDGQKEFKCDILCGTRDEIEAIQRSMMKDAPAEEYLSQLATRIM